MKPGYNYCPECGPCEGRIPFTVWRGEKMCHTCAVELAQRAVLEMTDEWYQALPRRASPIALAEEWADEERLWFSQIEHEALARNTSRLGVRTPTPHDPEYFDNAHP